MSETKVKRAPRKRTPKEIKNEEQRMIANGLSSAILGFDPGTQWGAQLSQADTLFKNNRWYLVSNMRQLLSEIFVEHGLIQTIVQVPVDDGLRGGIEIQSKQLDEEQITELLAEMEQEDDMRKMAEGLYWNRLFGGGGIILITDQDASMPLDLNSIRPDSPIEFRAVDMWELFWSHQNTSDYAAEIDGPNMLDVEYYDYYGVKIHKSRVRKLVGITAPSFIRPRLRGWGVSVVETLVRGMNQYLKATDLMFEVLDEFKVDVFKLKNLANTLLTPNGETNVRRRVALTNQQKNYQNAITMDAEDDYIQKELSFAGLAETMQGIRMQIASEMRMPLSKIFGISSTGFSSGEDDIENYNAMVESQVRAKAKYDIMFMVQIRCQRKFGFVPDDLKITFKPLRMLSAEQEENVKTQKFNRLLAAKNAGQISTLEFKDACNRDSLLPIQLDTSIESLDDQVESSDEGDSASEEVPVKDEKPATQAKEAKQAKNSLEYDVAAFEADGGEQQLGQWRYRQYTDPSPDIDKGLWSQAKEASLKAFGREIWQFVLWYYQKHGGVLK